MPAPTYRTATVAAQNRSLTLQRDARTQTVPLNYPRTASPIGASRIIVVPIYPGG